MADCRAGRAITAAVVTVLIFAGAASAGAQEDPQGESTPVAADEAVVEGRATVADGHVDLGPRFVDGQWTLLVRDDTVNPSVWRRLPDVVLQVVDASKLEIPDDPTFSFLGAPGDQVWLLPQVQHAGILWPGWNTQDPEVATTVEREVTWTLTDVQGPGAFSLYVNGEFGRPDVVFDSRQPFPQETGIDANTHAHGNWVFTAPGTYLLGVEMNATTKDGEQVAAAGTLRLAVGDATNPEDAFAVADTVPDEGGPVDSVDAADPAESDPTAPATADDDSSPVGPIAVAIALGAAVLLVGGLVWRRRRPRAVDESEP